MLTSSHVAAEHERDARPRDVRRCQSLELYRPAVHFWVLWLAHSWITQRAKGTIALKTQLICAGSSVKDVQLPFLDSR
eukprot:1683063-Amphidinium_carterae.1